MNNKIEFNIPKDVKYVLDEINNNGEEAYIVGGCVRDMLLGTIPSDWDITTSATPQKIKEIFKKTIDTGIEHGTVTVMVNKVGYEVTTYRVESDYVDYRRPSEVYYTRNLSEDLLRRDFTINAMAYNEVEGLVDLYNGVLDLEKKLIKCVGNAYDRFNEDALRMLRAVRFSAKLDFEIEEKTYEAITKLYENLSHISVERIQMELVKMLVSNNPEKSIELQKTKLMEYIIPELYKKLKGINKVENYFENIKKVSPKVVNRLVIFLHGISGVKQRLKKLSFDNKTIKAVGNICNYVDFEFENSDKEEFKYNIRKVISDIGIENFEILLEVKNVYKDMSVEKEYFDEILKNKDALTIKELDINGNDLINMGIKGVKIGENLNLFLEETLRNPNINNKNDLIKLIKN